MLLIYPVPSDYFKMSICKYYILRSIYPDSEKILVEISTRGYVVFQNSFKNV